jgi:hypothetical protein
MISKEIEKYIYLIIIRNQKEIKVNLRKRHKTNYNEEEIDQSQKENKLNRKRRRQSLKRGINCAWTVEDVK